MGIKFLCPHGHKLNVKTFLAGKKGVCPECGERFVVPLESQPKQRVASIGVSSALQAGVQAAHEGLPGGMHDGHVMATRDEHEPAVVGQAAPGQAVMVPSAGLPASGGQVLGGQVVGGPTAGSWASAPAAYAAAPVAAPAGLPVGVAPQTYAAPAPLDPLTEAPQATWYVRPPSGGQFGPAKSDLLRRWIGEGRVSADSLVWREDWPDWRTAGGLLPGVGDAPAPAPVKSPLPVAAPAYGAAAPSVLGSQPAATMAGPAAPLTAMGGGAAVMSGAPAGGASVASAATARPIVGRRPRSQYGLLIVIMLALIAILLLVALVYVIKSN